MPEEKTEPIFKLGRSHGSPSDKSIVIPHKLLFNLVPRALLFSGPGSSRRLGTRLTAIEKSCKFHAYNRRLYYRPGIEANSQSFAVDAPKIVTRARFAVRAMPRLPHLAYS